MTQDGDAAKLTELAVKFKEAIRQSIAKSWAQERYSTPVGETPPELRELLTKLDKEP
jgi:hypothetical protein